MNFKEEEEKNFITQQQNINRKIKMHILTHMLHGNKTKNLFFFISIQILLKYDEKQKKTCCSICTIS